MEIELKTPNYLFSSYHFIVSLKILQLTVYSTRNSFFQKQVCVIFDVHFKMHD